MNSLVIYDNSGYVISTVTSNILQREPIGIPFMWVDIPQGKKITGIDVSATPHQAVLEDIPPTETEIIKQQVADLNLAMASFMGV